MSKKVLVIENEPWLSERYEKTLRQADFEVISTSNAYSAMDMIDEERPSAIVMGLLLSGAGGLSLLHELQSYSDTATIPVIVCSNTTAGISQEDLEPYGVRRLLDIGTMQPGDVAAAVRSALA